jgi:hypothetical protein
MQILVSDFYSIAYLALASAMNSYGAARHQVIPEVEHRSHKGLNNPAENSHLPLRKRERMMQVSLPSATSSSQPAQADPHCKYNNIASAPWRVGKSSQQPSPETPGHCFRAFRCQQGDNAGSSHRGLMRQLRQAPNDPRRWRTGTAHGLCPVIKNGPAAPEPCSRCALLHHGWVLAPAAYKYASRTWKAPLGIDVRHRRVTSPR